MTRLKRLFLLLAGTLILSGCWDINENERMYYVQGMGVDYKDGEYEVFIQIISFSNVAKTESVNQDVIQSEVNSFKGKTLGEAFDHLYNAIDEKLYWGHFSFIILKDAAMEENRLNSVINVLTRFPDTRYLTWVYSTDEPLSEFLTVTPLLRRSITLTRVADPLNSFERESFIEPIDIRKLLIALNEPGYEVNIPYIRLKEGWESQKEPSKSIETAGIGILTPSNFKGYIKDEKALGLKWLTNETKQSRITTKIDNNQYISVFIKNLKTKIDPVIKGNKLQFDINIALTASLGSFTGKLEAKDIEQAVTKQITKEVKETYKAGLEKNIDIYRFSEVLYRQKVDVWQEKQTDGKIKLTEESIRDINISVQQVESGRKSFKESIE
ncbi:Ger(x)C family spore germination protein [Ureibacillus sinduriensis]|uniref:Uncharacterized protein n=1 Tax=Ureibacillus sinduriensis BLB-1 = JCM 15800 TaxID=1384057 RepID=A0A0A3IPY6_9BACL|nr:Ger(x)C family spore germination protein [Ureibacillus sinduriensis]KGR76907.1 hypothetical protein CD33_04320 [Ureibacillus sinduriensis BLB-1 = JCM 15800]